MKLPPLARAGFAAATLLTLSSWGVSHAQNAIVVAPTLTPAVVRADWTLRQRQDWLSHKLETAVADGAMTDSSFNQARLEMRNLANEESRMRHDADGQLTPNQTSELEARLDVISAKIRWANMTNEKRPW